MDVPVRPTPPEQHHPLISLNKKISNTVRTMRTVGDDLAGCSMQEELFASFEQLLALAAERGYGFDRCPPPLPTNFHFLPGSLNLIHTVAQH